MAISYDSVSPLRRLRLRRGQIMATQNFGFSVLNPYSTFALDIRLQEVPRYVIMKSKHQRLIIAHRGARFAAPENTTAAFDIALNYPIDGIELDVQLTKDDIAVVFHDRTLSKFKEPRKRVSHYRYEELRAKSWGSWYAGAYKEGRVITLDDVLRNYSQRTRLLIEVKSRSWDRQAGRSQTLTKRVIELIGKWVPEPYFEHTFILSFDKAVLDLAHRLAPHWNYVLNVSEPDSVIADNNFRVNGLYGFCISIRKITQEFKEFVCSQRRALFTHMCNTPRDMKLASKLDVDVLMTDKPAWIFQYLTRRGYMG